MGNRGLRQGAARLLLAFIARLGMLGLGLVFAQAAYSAWMAGDPPPASLFNPRATAEVIEARIVSGRQNGSIRHRPVVEVSWASKATELRGLKGAFYSGRLESEAAAAIKDYRIGETITVRVVNGLPYADTIDWFRLGAALWLSLFALAFLSVGAVIVIAGKRRPR